MADFFIGEREKVTEGGAFSTKRCISSGFAYFKKKKTLETTGLIVLRLSSSSCIVKKTVQIGANQKHRRGLALNAVIIAKKHSHSNECECFCLIVERGLEPPTSRV